MGKQIEAEMLEIIEKSREEWSHDVTDHTENEYIREGLLNEGYRKQSDTAKEIFAEVGKILTAKYNSIQAGCHHRMRYGNVDTPQGMEELGELSGVRQVIAEIKAFEKKYLEANDAESN